MIANTITSCRIIFSILMLMFPAFSSGFYACYLIAGISDMIDGTVARKLGTSSQFGERLDTVADFIFVATAFFKLIFVLNISKGIWIWIGVIAAIKFINIFIGFIRQKQFVTVHSAGNKITGAMLFILPLTISVIDISYSSVFVCIIATIAALHEGFIIGKQISPLANDFTELY